MRFLITAGPTREPLDAVRYLGNRSSGAMGVALANAAAGSGHGTTLLLGPVDSAVVASVDARVAVHRFETTAELESLLGEHFRGCGTLVMAAAVADYRIPAVDVVQQEKIARGETLTLRLEATPDLVAGCAARKRGDQTVVAFALEEPATLEARAAAKLERKGVDAIVANPLATMDADGIDAVLLWAEGRREVPGSGTVSKPEFAAWLMGRLSG